MENAIFLKTYTTPALIKPLLFNSFSANTQNCHSNGALRLTSSFFDLLEKQFQINAPDRKMKCRFPLDFASALSVHVNHLNRCLRDITGKTTSQHIAHRITLEAQTLLYNSEWNVCEIGYCFGFEEGPHFINLFKKNAKMSPSAYRRMVRFQTREINKMSFAACG